MTAPKAKARSNWRLPPFFEGLTHLGKATRKTKDGFFWVEQRGYGQEFVLEVPPESSAKEKVLSWLQSLPFAAKPAANL
jgi:hypothetical protein